MDINFILKFWFTLFPNLNKYFIVIISGFLGIICFGVFIGLLCEKRNEKLDNIYVGTSIVFLVCAIFFLFTARSFDKFEIPNVGYEEKTEIVESVELTDYILKTDIKGDNQFLHKIYGEITTDNIFHFRVIKEDGYSYFNKIAYDKDTFRHYHDETNTPKLEKIVTTKILKTYQNRL